MIMIGNTYLESAVAAHIAASCCDRQLPDERS